MSEIIFISGIGTDIGKSYATGWLAKRFMDEGKTVVTQKFIQTGNYGYSEDIEVHRRIMGTGMLPEDLDLTTSPIIFSYPASPQLAAQIDGKEIDLGRIDQCSAILAAKYDVVLVEGAGGLMVPLTDEFLTIDYPLTRRLPVILVTNGMLGSINHTILSLEAIKARGIKLHSVIYNEFYDTDKPIATDTKGFISRYIDKEFPGTEIHFVPKIIG